MARRGRPSTRGLLWMAGVSLLVVIGYERAKDKAAITGGRPVAAVRRGRMAEVRRSA